MLYFNFLFRSTLKITTLAYRHLFKSFISWLLNVLFFSGNFKRSPWNMTRGLLWMKCNWCDGCNIFELFSHYSGCDFLSGFQIVQRLIANVLGLNMKKVSPWNIIFAYAGKKMMRHNLSNSENKTLKFSAKICVHAFRGFENIIFFTYTHSVDDWLYDCMCM